MFIVDQYMAQISVEEQRVTEASNYRPLVNIIMNGTNTDQLSYTTFLEVATDGNLIRKEPVQRLKQRYQKHTVCYLRFNRFICLNVKRVLCPRVFLLPDTGLGPCRASKTQRSLCVWGGDGVCSLKTNS